MDLACRPLRLKSHPYHLPAVSPRASHMTSQCPSFLVCIIGEQRPTEKGLKFSGSQELRTSALEPTLQPTLCYSCGTWERLFNFFPALVLSPQNPPRGNFPGGPVAKTPPSNARGLGSIPGQGTRSHMLKGRSHLP